MAAKTLFSLVIAATALLNACSDSDVDPANPFGPIVITSQMDDSSSVLASGVISPDQLTSMQNLGFVSNEGDNPPSIEGSFVHEPVILQASSRSGDEDRIGDVFNSVIIGFSNQDSQLQTADLTFSEFVNDEPSDLSRSINSFITGNGSLFSAYFTVIDANSTENIPTSIIAISGELTTVGIINLQEAFFDFDTGTGSAGTSFQGESSSMRTDFLKFLPSKVRRLRQLHLLNRRLIPADFAMWLNHEILIERDTDFHTHKQTRCL